MPSLREPLEHVTTCYKAFGEAFCALVEAVGVVESEKPSARDAAIDEMCKRIKERTMARQEEELAEAKAEIERLNSKLVAMAIKVDVRKTAADNWLQRCKEAEHRLGVLAVQNQARDADAEIGRLVREMRPNTALRRFVSGYYYRMKSLPGLGWRTIADSGSLDPAEALRAIQEVGDGPKD